MVSQEAAHNYHYSNVALLAAYKIVNKLGKELFPMSTKEGVEMTSYSPANRAQKPAKGDTVTFWDLYERAAKNLYGENIRVIKTPWAQKQLDELNFQISVVDAEQTPKETSHTIIDINMKEYTNRGQKEIDKTMVKVSKSTSKTKGSCYSFSTTKGVDWASVATLVDK